MALERVLWLALALSVVAVLAGGAASGARAEELESINPNLVVNPDGEAGLDGWASAGWAIVPFGSSPTVPPAGYGSVPGFPYPHPYVFQAQTTGSTMSQEVSFARYVPEIEAGTEPVVVHVSLGGAGSEENGAEMIVQPEDANGVPLGPSVQLGPPTAADRKDQATIVSCHITFTAPVGMRSILTTIEAAGTAPGQPSSAMATSVSLQDLEMVAAIRGPREEPAQGPNCYVPGPPLTFGSPPAPAPPASHPADPPNRAKPLTRVQKLAKALAACKKVRTARKRRACIRTTKARYTQRRFGAG